MCAIVQNNQALRNSRMWHGRPPVNTTRQMRVTNPGDWKPELLAALSPENRRAPRRASALPFRPARAPVSLSRPLRAPDLARTSHQIRCDLTVAAISRPFGPSIRSSRSHSRAALFAVGVRQSESCKCREFTAPTNSRSIQPTHLSTSFVSQTEQLSRGICVALEPLALPNS